MKLTRPVKAVGFLTLMATIMVILFLNWMGGVAHQHRVRGDRYRLQGILNCLSMHAKNTSGTLPDGFGQLVIDACFPPSYLTSYEEKTSSDKEVLWELDQRNWTQTDVEHLDEVLRTHSAFRVVVWGRKWPLLPTDLVAYQRPIGDRDEVRVVYADWSQETLSRDEAARLIREAGHEPAWEE